MLGEALEVIHTDVREVPGLKKRPSTSELLDWLKLLGQEPEALAILERESPLPPMAGALLKNEQDLDLVQARRENPRGRWR